jgi:hypothetical protein
MGLVADLLGTALHQMKVTAQSQAAHRRQEEYRERSVDLPSWQMSGRGQRVIKLGGRSA